MNAKQNKKDPAWSNKPLDLVPCAMAALMGLLAIRCGESSRAAHVELEPGLPSARGVEEEAGQTLLSADGRARMVLPAGVSAHRVNAIIRALSHPPEALTGHIGSTYGVSFQERGTGAILTIPYDEKSLPLGADEADLVLGRMADNRWQEVRDANVDVVSNTVHGRIAFTGATDVYGVFVRPHPQFVNASFDEAVSSEKSSTGWIWDAKSSSEGGIQNINGNNVFLIQDKGQADADPRVRQTISGLTPGRNYTITGLFSGNGDCCEKRSVSSFGVAVDGRMILERSRPREEGLVPFSATLQATEKSHEISFIAKRRGSDATYLIDDMAITPIRGVRLHVAKTGPGKGTVLSHPDGIDCDPVCMTSFASGHSVTLIATAAPGSSFLGFSHGACPGGGTPICTLTMDSAKTVMALFTKASTNATLAKLETRADKSYAGGRIEPEFSANIEDYTIARIEQARFVTLIAEPEQAGATIQIGGQAVPSGQPVQIYFNGQQDAAVPIVVTAPDRQTTKRYTVKVCRWYCSNPLITRGTHSFSLKNG